MPTTSFRGTIERPPDEVFDFVADAENNPRWHAHVHETRWIDDGPTRLGRRGRQTGRLFGREWAFVAEVVEWDPPSDVTFKVIQGFKVRTRIAVEPSGTGSLVTVTVTTPPSLGPIDGFVSRLMERQLAARGRGDMERLRAALGAPPPVD